MPRPTISHLCGHIFFFITRISLVDDQEGLVRAFTCKSALKILRSHGLPAPQLHDVARTTTVASLMYASPSWTRDRDGWSSCLTSVSAVVFSQCLLHLPPPWSMRLI